MPEAIAWRPRGAGPTAQVGSVAQRQAAGMMMAAASDSVRPSAAADRAWETQLLPAAIVWRPRAVAAAVRGTAMARSSAAAESPVRRLARRVASVAQAAVLPQAAGHAVVGPQAAQDAAGAPQQAAEVSVGAAVPQQAAAARAGAEEVARQQEAAVPDVREVPLRAALPSAVPLAFRRDQAPPCPAPQPAAMFARAKERRRFALP
jgi:hypothetical protein